MGSPPTIQCPKCGHGNSPGSLRCSNCDSAISVEQNATLTSMGQATVEWSRAASHPGESAKQTLLPGTLLAGRYEILQILGQGGMGAVYKARDIELDRLLAVKVIRPDLAGDPKTLRRFKQELILARQITHKNVIRIFDLGRTKVSSSSPWSMSKGGTYQP